MKNRLYRIKQFIYENNADNLDKILFHVQK